MGKCLYKAVQELYAFLKEHSLPEMPDLASLEKILSGKRQNDLGCPIARISREMALKIGFSV